MAGADLPSTLRAALAAARNTDGGWGYAPGKSSRIEPTCWALLALARADKRPVEIDFIAQRPTENQWLVDVPGAPVNFAFNAVGALTLLANPNGAARADALARLLADVKGLRFDQAAAIRQDNSLQAWPWMDGTFSWVEPTSWCLLLMKKRREQLGPAAAERIRVGEAMLRDRACREGGWNYGSSNVYGQELFPYVPTTALGLLALQDQRTDSAVTRALERLRADFPSEPTPTALALTIVALRAHKQPVKAPVALLTDRLAKPRAPESTLGMAMGLYALIDTHGDTVFTL